MILLSRRIGEKLVIDGNIIVELVGINPGGYGARSKCKLGITAPEEVNVARSELLAESEWREVQRLAMGGAR